MSRTAVRVSRLPIYYNLCCTPIESFENVRMWLKEIERYAADYVEKLLIGNKSDLVAKKVVEYSIANVCLLPAASPLADWVPVLLKQELAESLNIPFLETSAKDSTNVDEMFYTMTRLIQQRYVALPPFQVTAYRASSSEKNGAHGGDKAGPPPGTTLSREAPEQESSGSCC